MGHINGVYGVYGWVKIYSYTRPKDNIFAYPALLVNWHQHWQERKVDNTQCLSQRLLLKLNGIDSPEQARQFNQCRLAVRRSWLPPLTAGEYYWCDLIGLEVYNQAAAHLGKVIDIIETGANDVLVINNGETAHVLIPLLIGSYVRTVDLAAQRITVDWEL